MNKQRMVVEWSPHDPALFSVGADNLRLFESTSTSENENETITSTTTQRKRSFRLMKINSQITQLKCMEWYPFDTRPMWIATGTGNGRVILSDFQDPRSRVVQEFLPKYNRPCNAVAWNHQVPNQLAAGFDKVRSDFCTLVWDLNTVSNGTNLSGAPVTGVSGVTTSTSGSIGDGGSSHGSGSGGGGDITMVGDSFGIGGSGLASAFVGTHLDDTISSSGGGTLGIGLGLGLGSGAGRGGSGPLGIRVGGGRGSGGSTTAELMSDRPIHELSNSEASLALSWVPFQPTCLAIGTGFKWLRIYDLRTHTSSSLTNGGVSGPSTVPTGLPSLSSASSSAPLSVVAHNKAVLGVVFDRHRPHILATYTEGSAHEAIKIWDIRRLDANTGPVVSLPISASRGIAQVSWCPTKPSILVTSSTEERWISLWDITKHDSANATTAGGGNNSAAQIKKPFKRRYTSDPVVSFSWQSVTSAVSETNTPEMKLTAAAFPDRLLTAAMNGDIEDISVHDSLPIAASPMGNTLAFSCGQLLFAGRTTEDDQGDVRELDHDIALDMRRLAKAGYSMTLTKNLELFDHTSTSRERQLRVLWEWVDQVEGLRRIHASRMAQSQGESSHASLTALRGWPLDPQALAMVGVKNLLALPATAADGTLAELSAIANGSAITPSGQGTIHSVLKCDAVLGCAYYDGIGRRLTMLAGHWDPDCGQGDLADTSTGVSSQSPTLQSQGGLLGTVDAMLLPQAPRPNKGHVQRATSGGRNASKQVEDPRMSGNSVIKFSSRSESENSRHELGPILIKCETEGQFARAAALAVFHGDLMTAVEILQRGAIANQNPTGTDYSSDVLQLVAMAIAGYSTSGSGQSASLWTMTCQQLLRREEITSTSQPRYLHALLAFLCITSQSTPIKPHRNSTSSTTTNVASTQPSQSQTMRRGGGGSTGNAIGAVSHHHARRSWGSADGLSVLATSRLPATNSLQTSTSSSAPKYAVILHDVTVPLSDRLAFAARYLAADDLSQFVRQCEEDCFQLARLEGILLTGLNNDGLNLLQRYVDKTGDIQTVALLSARLPSSLSTTSSPPSRWITLYQDLLNQWQFFHERARFDVGRAQLEDVLNSFAAFVRDPDGEELAGELAAPSTFTVPPQLFVRCNYCSTSLSLANLLRMGGLHSSWLNRAKPKLSCCPSCRKPLPQCAICLAPLGALNPYLELAHRRSKQTAEAASLALATSGDVTGSPNTTSGVPTVDETSTTSKTSAESESLSQLSSIPFIEWFTWCQSCKHGGHAHHMADWFASHQICPVTECECRCQSLDLPLAIQKQQVNAVEEREESQEACVEQQQLSQQQLHPQQRGIQQATSPQRNTLGSRNTTLNQLFSQGQPTITSGLPPAPSRSGFGRSGHGSSASISTGGIYTTTTSVPPISNQSTSVGPSGSEMNEMFVNRLSLSNKLDQLDKDTKHSAFKYI